jgi:hypothetical protein
MADLFVFYPRDAHLIVEFLGARYIERQPKTPEETVIFLDSLKPVVKQLDDYVEKHGLREILELNLKGVPIRNLDSETAVNLITVMTSLRADKGHLAAIHITNSSPLFSLLYRGVKSRLPQDLTRLITVT